MTEDEVKKIYYEEYIGQHIGTHTLKRKYHCHIYEQFKKYNLPIRNDKEKNKKYICNNSYFENIDTQEKAYWLGFIYADGYISKNNNNGRFGISLSTEDIDHLYKFKESIESSHPINKYRVSSGYKIGAEYCRIIICEEKLVNDLIKQGCVYNKTNILSPPNIDKKLRRHFIRGYMDGDGSIIIHKNKYCDSYNISFSSTDSVLNWIMDELLEDNIIDRRYPLTKRKEGQIVSTFCFGGNYLVKKYCDYIYEDATIYLDRKHDRYIQLIELLKQKEDKKIKHYCDICGNTESVAYRVWHRKGEYEGCTVCQKHYLQLYKHNKIISDKKSHCDICGDDYGRLIHCGIKHIEYLGMTMCRKHYEQLDVYGKITDISKGWHKNE